MDMESKCDFCGKDAPNGYCNLDCFYNAHRRDSYNQLHQLLKVCIGKKLIAFNVSPDGGQAILTFENKTVILGAGGNLWDEAYPVFEENKGEAIANE